MVSARNARALQRHQNRHTDDRPAKNKPTATPKKSAPLRKPAIVDAYFDQAGRRYYCLNAQGEWMGFDKDSFKLHLAIHNHSTKVREGECVSAADRYIHACQFTHSVHFAGELAGFLPGMRIINGHRVLITRGPKFITPKEGKWPLLARFFRTLLGPEQIYFFGWLKGCLVALKNGPPFREGQVLCIAGDMGSGKNLAQKIITECLGGRVGNPWSWLSGESGFTEDFDRAEHLQISDEVSNISVGKRIQLKQRLKTLIVNKDQRCNGKGLRALMLTPFRRVSITINDQPENIAVLPPPDKDIADKMILLHASHGARPMDRDPGMSIGEQWEMFAAELPAFLYFLRRLRIGKTFADPNNRFAVRSYMNPKLLTILTKLDPEARLLDLIDSLDFAWPADGLFVGKATAFEMRMRSKDSSNQLDKIMPWQNAFGALLRKLSEQHPMRVAIVGEEDKTNVYAIARKGYEGRLKQVLEREPMSEGRRKALFSFLKLEAEKKKDPPPPNT
jgi:hypothetical protein